MSSVFFQHLEKTKNKQKQKTNKNKKQTKTKNKPGKLNTHVKEIFDQGLYDVMF